MQNLQLVDTHCHLYAEEFHGERWDVIKQAKDAGVLQDFSSQYRQIFHGCHAGT